MPDERERFEDSIRNLSNPQTNVETIASGIVGAATGAMVGFAIGGVLGGLAGFLTSLGVGRLTQEAIDVYQSVPNKSGGYTTLQRSDKNIQVEFIGRIDNDEAWKIEGITVKYNKITCDLKFDGSRLDDRIEGCVDSNDYVSGNGGNDIIKGLSGWDSLYGGDGSDRIYGGSDDDFIFGDNGDDTLYGETGIDRIYGGKGKDLLYGGDGNDVLDGGDDADTIISGKGRNTISAGSGNDKIYVDNSRVSGDYDLISAGRGEDSLHLIKGSSSRITDIEYGDKIYWRDGSKGIEDISVSGLDARIIAPVSPSVVAFLSIERVVLTSKFGTQIILDAYGDRQTFSGLSSVASYAQDPESETLRVLDVYLMDFV